MRISDWSSDVCSSDLAMQPAELDLDDAGHLLARQAVEQQDLVQAVEELRPEGAPHHLHHLLAHGGTVLPLRLAREDLGARSEEHTSELQSLMRISYAVFCLKKKQKDNIDKGKT